jgi:hypothetical protein
MPSRNTEVVTSPNWYPTMDDPRLGILSYHPDEMNGQILVCPVAEPSPRHTVTGLIECLAREQIAWCYWKSARRARYALSGQSDVDFLVDPRQQHAARRALVDCGFKMFRTTASRDDPGIESFLAHDDASGRLVHVHFHSRLMVGGALLKNYRLPWEESLVSRAAPGRGTAMPILDPASEAVLLIVRACLELRRTDPVIARRWSAATRRFALDRADLAERIDHASVKSRARELLGGRRRRAGGRRACRRSTLRESAEFAPSGTPEVGSLPYLQQCRGIAAGCVACAGVGHRRDQQKAVALAAAVQQTRARWRNRRRGDRRGWLR